MLFLPVKCVATTLVGACPPRSGNESERNEHSGSFRAKSAAMSLRVSLLIFRIYAFFYVSAINALALNARCYALM